MEIQEGKPDGTPTLADMSKSPLNFFVIVSR